MKDKQSCLYPKGRQPTKNNHHQRAADGKVFVSATSVDDQCHHRRDMMKKIFHSYHQIAYDALPTGNIAELDTNDEKWDLSSWTLILSDNCMDHLICRNNISIIKDLDLSGADGITDVGLIKLANKIPQLMSLSLEQASQITEIGLSHLVQRCCKLQILNLSQCCGISGNGFAVLGQYASGLLKLSLSGCGQITSYSLLAIFQGCKMLTDLDLSLSAVTDKEISVLGTSCRDIKVLNLKGCVRVSDYGVLGLSKGLCNLTNFTISRNDMVTSITDVSLLAISEDCQCLKIIDLSGCQMLTDISLCWLAKGCKYLQQLNLTNCSKVTNAGIQYLGEGESDVLLLGWLLGKK
jgi:Leucine Rich Repeat.